MSDKVKIKTGKVNQVAVKIDGINNKIDSDFERLCSDVSKLSSSWKTPNSQIVINKFSKMKKAYKAPRRKAIKQITDFMTKEVEVAYKNTEDATKKAADMFL